MGLTLQDVDVRLTRIGSMIEEIAKRRAVPLAALSFAEQLQIVKTRLKDTYFRETIDLSVARTNERHAIAGSAIFIRSASDDPDAIMDIRLWRTDMPLIPVRMQSQIRAPFDEFFLTNAIQVGRTLDIFIAQEPDLFALIESPSLDAQILAELQGSLTMTPGFDSVTTDVELIAANANRKSILVTADPTNAIDLMLGNSALVAAAQNGNTFARLSPGQAWGSDDYRGAVFAEAADAATATRAYHNETV